jgi:small subunit ribosomal protein S19
VSRSLKKGPFVDLKLERKVLRMNRENRRDPITTWARACTITPDFVGHTFMVHDGRRHQKVYVVEDMVGHKLGEFAVTRTFRGHTNKKDGGKGK